MQKIKNTPKSFNDAVEVAKVNYEKNEILAQLEDFIAQEDTIVNAIEEIVLGTYNGTQNYVTYFDDLKSVDDISKQNEDEGRVLARKLMLLDMPDESRAVKSWMEKVNNKLLWAPTDYEEAETLGRHVYYENLSNQHAIDANDSLQQLQNIQQILNTKADFRQDIDYINQQFEKVQEVLTKIKETNTQLKKQLTNDDVFHYKAAIRLSEKAKDLAETAEIKFKGVFDDLNAKRVVKLGDENLTLLDRNAGAYLDATMAINLYVQAQEAVDLYDRIKHNGCSYSLLYREAEDRLIELNNTFVKTRQLLDVKTHENIEKLYAPYLKEVVGTAPIVFQNIFFDNVKFHEQYFDRLKSARASIPLNTATRKSLEQEIINTRRRIEVFNYLQPAFEAYKVAMKQIKELLPPILDINSLDDINVEAIKAWQSAYRENYKIIEKFKDNGIDRIPQLYDERVISNGLYDLRREREVKMDEFGSKVDDLISKKLDELEELEYSGKDATPMRKLMNYLKESLNKDYRAKIKQFSDELEEIRAMCKEMYKITDYNFSGDSVKIIELVRHTKKRHAKFAKSDKFFDIFRIKKYKAIGVQEGVTKIVMPINVPEGEYAYAPSEMRKITNPQFAQAEGALNVQVAEAPLPEVNVTPDATVPTQPTGFQVF
jgi:hypothetical protein